MEVITFECPSSTLYVSGLSISMEHEEKWKVLHDSFSKHGLLYEIYIPINEPYAFIRYYSHKSANSALNHLHRKLMIGGRLINVALSSGAYKYSHKQLHITKCHQLINYYLGFNGWTIEMKEWNKSVKSNGQITYSCLVLLKALGWNVECEGRATVETTEDSLNIRAVIQKQCYQKACESAFSKLAFVVSSNSSFCVLNLSGRDTVHDSVI